MRFIHRKGDWATILLPVNSPSAYNAPRYQLAKGTQLSQSSRLQIRSNCLFVHNNDYDLNRLVESVRRPASGLRGLASRPKARFDNLIVNIN